MTRDIPQVRWTEWDDEDPLFRQLRLTVRRSLAPDGTGSEGLPVKAGSAKDAWDALTEVGAWDFAVPIDHGGLELGHAVLAMVCEEVGRSLRPVPLLDTLIALDLLCGAAAPDLLDRVRSGDLPVAVAGRLPGPDGSPPQRTDAPFPAGVEPGALLAFSVNGPSVRLVMLPSPGVEVKALPERGGGPAATAVLAETARTAGPPLLHGVATREALARVGLRAAVYQAALLTGLAGRALDALVERVRSRQQFGQALVKHQAPRHRAAALLARMDALRWAVTEAARDLDRAALPVAEAAGLLALTAETALEVAREAVHLHGAAGLARDSVVAACYSRVAWEALRCGSPAALWETTRSDAG